MAMQEKILLRTVLVFFLNVGALKENIGALMNLES